MSAPLRVVHFLNSFAPGGMEHGIANVIRGTTDGFTHAIVARTDARELPEWLPEGTPVVEMQQPPGNSIRFLFRLRRVFRELKADIVHTRNWAGLDGILAARLGGIRNVVHGEHGFDIGDPDGSSRKRRFFRRRLLPRTRHITCVSRDMERWLKESVGTSRPITQIYNGVDTDRFAPGADAEVLDELGLPSATFVAVIVARLDPIKAHDVLFEAWREVRRSVPGAVLLVVGDGPSESDLRRLAGEGVHMLGARKDVPAILRTADLSVLCSRNEGVSNTILEAMSTGLPVVATEVGGNRELVADGETGRLVPPADPAALAAAIGVYADDAMLRHEHGAAGRQRVLVRFGIEAMVRSYEAVWRDVAG